jgi:hypothetical protein
MRRSEDVAVQQQPEEVACAVSTAVPTVISGAFAGSTLLGGVTMYQTSSKLRVLIGYQQAVDMLWDAVVPCRTEYQVLSSTAMRQL